LARPERQIVRGDINDHRQADEKRGDPEKRAVVDSLPRRPVWRVFGGVGSAVLLKLDIVHGREP
jgi:hypothetical protein